MWRHIFSVFRSQSVGAQICNHICCADLSSVVFNTVYFFLYKTQVFYRQPDDLERIDTSHVPSKRWLSTCSVCNSTGGACIDCTEIGCALRFHVSCALRKNLAMEFRDGRNGAIVISFCEEHTAAWEEVLPTSSNYV